MVEAKVSNWILMIIPGIFSHNQPLGALNSLGFSQKFPGIMSCFSFKRLGIPTLIRPTLHQFALRRGDLDSKQHRICRWFQYNKAGKAKDADSGLFFCQCSFQPLHFLNNMSHQWRTHVDWGVSQEENSPEWDYSWHEVDYNLNLPIQIDIQSGNLINLLFPVFVYNDFESKNDHLLGESGTSKHQVLSRFIGSLRLMKRLLWSVFWCFFFSPRISVSNRMISHL